MVLGGLRARSTTALKLAHPTGVRLRVRRKRRLSIETLSLNRKVAHDASRNATFRWRHAMNQTFEPVLPVGTEVMEYMCHDQLAFFQSLLERERDVLLNAARSSASELKEISPTPDPSDRASLEEDHAMESNIRGRELRQLHAIDQALLRVRNGTYGWCEESGDPIGLARLVARPTATLCLAEQQRQESLDMLNRRH